MTFKSNTPRGFTLLELLIVISIIAILAASLFPVFAFFKKRALAMQARKTMDTLAMALEDYRKDFNAYPPDSGPGVGDGNGSQMIAYFLTRAFAQDKSISEMHYGPYLQVKENDLKDVNGKPTNISEDRLYFSPTGGQYKYAVLVETVGGKDKEIGYVLVDPGPDKQLGGTISKATGFTRSDPKAAADNIYDPQTAAIMQIK